MGAATARADTIYTYTGNDFTQAPGPYTTTDFVTVTIDLATALGPNYGSNTIAADDIVSFSFSDGVQTLTSTTPGFSATFNDIVTGATGDIISWDINIQNASDTDQINSCNVKADCLKYFGSSTVSDVASYQSGLDLYSAKNINDPGGWTVTTTPLPAALPLFAGGLGAMDLLGWRRKRKNPTAITA